VLPDTMRRYRVRGVTRTDYLLNQSFYGGNTWAAIVGMPCRAFDIKPPESQVFSGLVSANKTSSPILFVGTTNDPVAPLRSAKKMASQFCGSTVLAVDGTGHSSYSVPSHCVWKHIQTYLTDTSLPPPDTLCKADKLPFSAGGGGGAKRTSRHLPAF